MVEVEGDDLCRASLSLTLLETFLLLLRLKNLAASAFHIGPKRVGHSGR